MNWRVCVLSYNHPGITADCVRSALNVGVRPNQIHLVHNGSTEKFVTILFGQYPHLRHEILLENRGYAAGANFAMTRAFQDPDVDWVIFLSNDCRLMNLPTLPLQPSLVGPKVFIRNTDRVDSLGALFHPSRGKLEHLRVEGDFERRQGLRYIPGTAFLIHRDVFENLDGFDESYGTYWEDVDLGIRAGEAQVPMQVQTNWVVRHGVGKTCHSDSVYTIYHFQRNRKKLSWRYSTVHDRIFKLVPKLAWDWWRLSFRLMRTRRFGDLKRLAEAVLR